MKTKLIPILFVGLLAAQSANAEKMPSMPSMMDDAMDAIERKMEEYRQESLKRSRAADIVPNEEKDGSLEDWIKTEATFNYKLPCDINKTVAVAVVIHGVNRMDELEENDEGDFVYARDMSIAFPRMEELCIAIAIPKSGISTTWKTDDTTANPPHSAYTPSYHRAWWMTKGVEPDDSYIPVRDEKEEIAAIIELIGIANEAVKKPVFVVIGNDLGVLTSKVISALEEEEKITAIAGFISVNRETGEFTGHLRDGTTWESKDQPTNTTGEN
jgi:hypothetical protein